MSKILFQDDIDAAEESPSLIIVDEVEGNWYIEGMALNGIMIPKNIDYDELILVINMLKNRKSKVFRKES